jgi:hypothetical protein
LNHPFLSKDRPIFKFKKVYREEEMEETEVPMRVYRNLEDMFEEESPRKTKSTLSSSTSLYPYKPASLSKYYEEVSYYDPFCHEAETETEEKHRRLGRLDEEKMIFTILERHK